MNRGKNMRMCRLMMMLCVLLALQLAGQTAHADESQTDQTQNSKAQEQPEAEMSDKRQQELKEQYKREWVPQAPQKVSLKVPEKADEFEEGDWEIKKDRIPGRAFRIAGWIALGAGCLASIIIATYCSVNGYDNGEYAYIPIVGSIIHLHKDVDEPGDYFGGVFAGFMTLIPTFVQVTGFGFLIAGYAKRAKYNRMNSSAESRARVAFVPVGPKGSLGLTHVLTF